MCGALINIRKKNFLETTHMIRAATYHFHEVARVLPKPLKTLWKSTMGVQSASTLPTDECVCEHKGALCKIE